MNFKLIPFILFLTCLPICFVIFFLILIEDGYPVIFRSKRVGKDGKEFTFYKFRTMIKEAPLRETNKLFNSKDYILKSGKFLRKYSFDELPNLWNVIIGDMNLIGYRPCLPEQKNLINHRTKLGIDREKPGITGLAQVRGRDMVDDRSKIRFEYFYHRNKNTCLNIYILKNTIFSYKKVLH